MDLTQERHRRNMSIGKGVHDMPEGGRELDLTSRAQAQRWQKNNQVAAGSASEVPGVDGGYGSAG
jgi:hypothetical protein